MEKKREQWSASGRLRLSIADAAHEGGRRATWLELFFDLVYVVAIANLGKLLLADHTPLGALVFLGLFVPVWWAWIGISYFIDQYHLPELPLRVLMLGQIGLSLGLAIGLPEVVKGHPEVFVWSYLGLRATLTALYVWAWRTHEAGRELNAKYALGFGIGTALWAVSLLVDGPARYVLWGAALVLEIAATILAYTTTRNIPVQVSHMDERFGLFTIIVLGESVLAVASGTGHAGGPAAWAVAGVGLLLAGLVWWLYFDTADHGVIDRALRGGRSALARSFVYGYTHLLVFAAIVAASIGIELAFEDAAEDHLSGGARLLLCGGLALYLAALTVVQRAGKGGLSRSATLARSASAAALAALGVFGAALSVPAALALVLAVLGAVVVYEHVSRDPRGEGEAPTELDLPAAP